MALNPKYLPGSFRGVPFEVESTNLQGGRRGPLHEYPQEDTPWKEDMGRKGRTYPITAFVLGDDYLTKRNALKDALEKGGTGALVHPTYGKVNVDVDTFDISESTASTNQARFTITFQESGKTLFPTTAISPISAVAGKASDMGGSVLSVFETAWNTINQASWIVENAIDAVTSKINSVTAIVRKYASPDALRRFTRKMDDMADSINTLVNTPAQLAEDWRDALIEVANVIPRVAESIVPDWVISFANATESGLLEPQLTDRNNLAAIDQLIFTLSIADSVDAFMESGFDTIVSYDQARTAIDAFSLLFESGEEFTPQADLFVAMQETRITFSTAVEDQSLELPRARDYTPPAVTSTPQLAQLFYGDGTRAPEVGQLGGVFHPLFVPVKNIRILTE